MWTTWHSKKWAQVLNGGVEHSDRELCKTESIDRGRYDNAPLKR